MKAKSIIHKELEEQGEINITEVASKVFEEKVPLKFARRANIFFLHYFKIKSSALMYLSQ